MGVIAVLVSQGWVIAHTWQVDAVTVTELHKGVDTKTVAEA